MTNSSLKNSFIYKILIFPPLNFLECSAVYFIILSYRILQTSNIDLHNDIFEILKQFCYEPLLIVLALILIVISAIFSIGALYLFVKNKINPAPFTLQSKIIFEQGVYKYSRNPMYLSLLFIHLAIGLYVYPLLLPITTLILIKLLSIEINREESFLAQNNSQYLLYKTNVRRWL